jgi:AraC-like DNA-binding protein
MEFSFHAPPPSIADSVKAIWCARGTKEEFDAPEPIVPDGCIEIVFDLGDPFINAQTGEVQPRDLIAGQMTRPVIALPTGPVDLIGVRLHTARGGAALRIPMSELQDRLLPASSVLRHADRLADDLINIDDPGRRLAHLCDALTGALGPTSSSDGVDHALAMIAAARGSIAVATVATRVGVSRRHLERQFRERVGLGVKQIARITRIHAALEMLQQRPELSGAEIAAECGYSDQAHLIRECQELAGQTPQRLKSTERSLAGLIRAEGAGDLF